MTRRIRRLAGIPLTAIAAVFAASLVVRLGAVGVAVADDVSLPPPTLLGRAECLDPASVDAALARVAGRADALDAREAALEDRARALSVSETLIADRLAELEAAETRLAALLARSDTAADGDLDRLTRVYESMEPQAAAPLFETMDVDFAAGFIGRMAPEAAAALMARLSPEQAYALSVVLAGRNAAAPTADGG